MLKSYEAIYDHGQIRWLDAPPDVDQARLIVTLLPLSGAEARGMPAFRPGSEPSAISADALLADTAGAWGRRSLDEVQALIASRRQADWGDD